MRVKGSEGVYNWTLSNKAYVLAVSYPGGIESFCRWLVELTNSASCPLCCDGEHSWIICPHEKCWTCGETGHWDLVCPNENKLHHDKALATLEFSEGAFLDFKMEVQHFIGLLEMELDLEDAGVAVVDPFYEPNDFESKVDLEKELFIKVEVDEESNEESNEEPNEESYGAPEKKLKLDVSVYEADEAEEPDPESGSESEDSPIPDEMRPRGWWKQLRVVTTEGKPILIQRQDHQDH